MRKAAMASLPLRLKGSQMPATTWPSTDIIKLTAGLDQDRIGALTRQIESCEAAGNPDSSGWEAEKARFHYLYGSLLETGETHAKALTIVVRALRALPEHRQELFISDRSADRLKALAQRLRKLLKDIKEEKAEMEVNLPTKPIVIYQNHGSLITNSLASEISMKEHCLTNKMTEEINEGRKYMSSLVQGYLDELTGRGPEERLVFDLGDIERRFRNDGTFEEADREFELRELERLEMERQAREMQGREGQETEIGGEEIDDDEDEANRESDGDEDEYAEEDETDSQATIVDEEEDGEGDDSGTYEEDDTEEMIEDDDETIVDEDEDEQEVEDKHEDGMDWEEDEHHPDEQLQDEDPVSPLSSSSSPLSSPTSFLSDSSSDFQKRQQTSEEKNKSYQETTSSSSTSTSISTSSSSGRSFSYDSTDPLVLHLYSSRNRRKLDHKTTDTLESTPSELPNSSSSSSSSTLSLSSSPSPPSSGPLEFTSELDDYGSQQEEEEDEEDTDSDLTITDVDMQMEMVDLMD